MRERGDRWAGRADGHLRGDRQTLGRNEGGEGPAGEVHKQQRGAAAAPNHQGCRVGELGKWWCRRKPERGAHGVQWRPLGQVRGRIGQKGSLAVACWQHRLATQPTCGRNICVAITCVFPQQKHVLISSCIHSLLLPCRLGCCSWPLLCCRHQLSLYAHVSKITWQFDRPNRVAGTVSTPRQLRTFDFDPATTPDFAIVNELWDLMGTD